MAQPRTRGTRVSLAQAIALALGAFALALVLRPSGGLGSLVRVVLVSIALVLGSGLAWLAVLLGSAYFVDKGAASAEAGGARASGARAVWRRQPFMFTTSAAWFQLRTQQTWLDSASGYDRAARGPSVSDSAALEAAVDQLVVLVLRDFVLKWFTSISSSRAFPLAVEKTLRETLARAAELLADVDVAGTLVGHLLPLANTHIDLFERAERVLRGADGRARLTTSDELDLFLAAKYAGLAQGGSLHPAIDVASPTSKPTEEAWLRQFVARLLPKVLPSEEAASPAVFVMVREILACAVLYPVIDLLSDPDFWNRLIDVKAGDAIREQHLVTEFRKALDQQGSNIDVAALSGRRQAKEPFGEAISVHTTRKDFDQFIRAIAKCTSLLEARRTANDLSRLIRQTQSVLSEIRVDDVAETRPDARRETDYQAFLERLQVAKAKADHRIQELGGMRTASAVSLSLACWRLRCHGLTVTWQQSDAKAQDDEATVALRDILLQPASLSYFMEFQDRRRRSVRPQFWVLVEGLKDPLENEPDAASDNEEAVVPIPPSKAATAADDIRMVWDMYLANCLIEVDERLTNTIETFVSNRDKPVDLKQLYRARRAVFAAQREIFAEMEAQDFSAFQGTELYFKAVSNMAPTTTPPGTLSRPTVRRSLSHPAPASEPLVSPPISSPPISRPMQLSSSATSSQLNTRPSTAVALTSALQQRTDTAPPQVTVKPLFENESSLGLGHATRPSLSRPSSVRSNDSVHGHRRVSPMSDSLDFLMHASATEDDASRPPLFQEDVVTPAEKQTMDAIQDALSTLLEADAKGTTVEGKKRPELASRVAMTPEALSPTGSTILERPAERLPSPSATTFSRAATSKRKRIFDDDDDDRYDADEALDADGADTAPLTGLSAASVDKGALPAEIKRLAGEIAKLEKQEAVVQALIRKAELTGRASELKILVKSRESLRREISGLTFQKMQYESQDAESKLLPGRTKVTLPGTTQGRTGLQTYQLYLIEVRQLSTEGTLSRGWMISRRYSEFFSLHAALRERFPQVRALDLPGKRLVSHKNESFVEERRAGLEKYLQVSS